MNYSIDDFIRKIPHFLDLPSSEMIPYFVYYLNMEKHTSADLKMLKDCFAQLKIKEYSNISAFLSKKTKGKNSLLLKDKKGYSLTRKKCDEISKIIDNEQDLSPTDDLVELAILDCCPFYVKKISDQMNSCYDNSLYDACLVMMRKLFETLIIECFEKYSIQSEIKNSENEYYYFSELINRFLTSTKWEVSRNFKKNISVIKKYGDLSAHNRRFFARKNDINTFKFELRQCLQEIVLIIGY